MQGHRALLLGRKCQAEIFKVQPLFFLRKTALLKERIIDKGFFFAQTCSDLTGSKWVEIWKNQIF
ncbi:MAG: hypothetical protein A3E80_03965 [Chlamydiae bacterium RIFCSPHIGHO2_12_FULL_49_9]|nr:MAG: hypothetical protein A3E80_03965 [Chlamydiae bacterium RIFCSPHIGHO2_12_FULL_49_9]